MSTKRSYKKYFMYILEYFFPTVNNNPREIKQK